MTKQALQTEETVEEEVVETEAVETVPESSGESTEEGAESAPVKTEREIIQDGAQKAINKQAHLKHEALREKERVQKELDAAKEELAKVQSVSPTIPPMPDQYDDDYDEKVRQRDEAIKTKAVFDGQQLVLAQQQQQKLVDQQAEYQAKVDGVTQKFNLRSSQLGIDPDARVNIVNTLRSYQLPLELEMFIAEREEDGPLVAKYLVANPMVVDTLQGLSLANAAEFVALKIAPEAAKLKPKQTSAPDPLDIDSGAVMPEKGDPLLKGVVYE